MRQRISTGTIARLDDLLDPKAGAPVGFHEAAFAQLVYGDCLVTKALLKCLEGDPTDALIMEVGMQLACLRHLRNLRNSASSQDWERCVRFELTTLLQKTDL
jgi:hypothetical protein